jgi:AraC-like DNA-binding protein
LQTQFSLFDLLVLIGITQGVVTAVLLLRNKENKSSNRLLGLVLLGFCFLSTKILIWSLNLWNTSWIRFFPNGIELALAPLVYFYVKSLLDKLFRFGWKQWVHFIPFLISQTYAFLVYFSVISVRSIERKDAIADSLRFDQVKNTEDYLALLSLIIYIIVGFVELNAYRKWLKISVSDNTVPEYNWLRNIFLLSATLGVLLFVNLFFNNIAPDDPYRSLRLQVYFVFISFLIYYLGFMGYQQRNVSSVLPIAREPQNEENETSSNYDPLIIDLLEKALTQDKVFLNPTLSIQELAKSLVVNQRELSNVINGHFQKPFRDLINSYRVEETKKKLLDSKFSHLSVLGIALEAGFNSEASFYRIFKKNTGLSPKEYMVENG